MKHRAVTKATKYMLRECGHGSVCACQKAKKVLAAGKLEGIYAGASVTFMDADWNDKGHPNRMPFKGVLLLVDVASTKPPHGSRGHRIYVPKEVAQKHLSGLIGMGVNYDPEDLDSHVTQHKVGIVTKAWLEGNQVWVSGIVYKKDFPEAERDLKRGGLGMSMELANVYVRDEDEPVWHLEDFEFTGATILKKSAAAYYQTELAATSEKKSAKAVAAAATRGENGAEMGQTNKNKRSVAAASNSGNGALLVSAIKGALSEALSPMVQEIKASNERMSRVTDELEELKGLQMIQAAAEQDEEDLDLLAAKEEDEEDMDAKAEEDDDEDMDAAKDKKEEDDGEDTEDDSDEDDLDAMEDLEKEAAEEEPGELNKGAKNQGDKNSVADKATQGAKVSGNIAEKRLQSASMRARGKRIFPGLKSSTSIHAAAVQIATLSAQMQSLKKQYRSSVAELKAAAAKRDKQYKKLRGQYASLEAQAEKWADQVERRSVVPVELRNLAAKANIDLHELKAQGQKLPVEAVDQMFAIAAEQGIQIDTTMKAAYKNRLHEMGMMESGEVKYTN